MNRKESDKSHEMLTLAMSLSSIVIVVLLFVSAYLAMTLIAPNMNTIIKIVVSVVVTAIISSVLAWINARIKR